jgi:HlyD family secretion protein
MGACSQPATVGVFQEQEVLVTSATEGQLCSFTAKTGSRLKTGQVIGKVDTSLLYIRKQQLLAMQKEDAAGNEQKKWSEQLEQTERHLRNARIINPVNGTVVASYIRDSAVVMPEQPLYTIADRHNLLLLALVTAKMQKTLQLQQKVNVFPVFPDNAKAQLSGTIVQIGSKPTSPPNSSGSDAKSYFLVKIAVDNSDEMLHAGMTATVNIPSD